MGRDNHQRNSNSNNINKSSPHPFKEENLLVSAEEEACHCSSPSNATNTINNNNNNNNTTINNEQHLRTLLNELSFWEQSSPECSDLSSHHAKSSSNGINSCNRNDISSNTNDISNSNSNGEMTRNEQQKQHEVQRHEATAMTVQVNSPTLQELEAANTWQKAVDPASGRTYYYDSITRQSQWDKVRPLHH